MIVRFNSLNRFETPKFTLCDPGSVYNNGRLSKVVGILIDHEAEECVLNFNSTSELNLRVNKIHRENAEENEHAYSLYKAIQNRRLIFVDDIGYFMIQSVDEGYSNGVSYKDIKAKSIDIEIAQKMIPYIEDGTYRFLTEPGSDNEGILEKIVETLPLWTIGTVDDAVEEKWRTFEDVNVNLNCLGFLIDEVQDAYECIIIFDAINRIINVYDQNNYVQQTSIHITRDDLINSIEVSENADDLYTAISVLGDDNITISAINPLGSNVIYNFDYYIEWMSGGLGAKVTQWQTAVENAKASYYDLNLQYYTKLEDVAGYQAEIDRIDTQITMYQRCRDNIVAESNTSTVSSYNTAIVSNGGTAIEIHEEISDTLAEIDSLISACQSEKARTTALLNSANASASGYLQDIEAVHNSLSITSYFTVPEYTELCHYIYEGSYHDDYVVITDVMTYSQKFEQMKILYDRAESQLERVSQPTQEFDIDVENFIFAKEFEHWSEQLETGCLINAELDIDDIALLFLSTITINYDDHKLTMRFGNRFNKFDPRSLFDGVLGDISRSANTLNYIKEVLYPIKSGQFNEFREALQNTKNLTMNSVLASTNEEVIIDGSGYTGKKKLNDGTYDPRQLKIVNSGLYLTDDNWETAKAGIGEFVFWNPDTQQAETSYGVIADMLASNLILSERVGIYNSTGTTIINEDGLTMTVDNTNPDANRIAFTIQEKLLDSNQEEYMNPLFYIDSDGHLVLNGSVKIRSTSGTSSFTDTFNGIDSSVDNKISDALVPVNSRIESMSEVIIESDEISAMISQQIVTNNTTINSTTDGKISSAIAPINQSISGLNGDIMDINVDIGNMNTTINNLSEIVMTPTQISASISQQITAYDSTVDNKISNATTNINSTTDGKISDALVPINTSINNLSEIVMTPTQISAEVSQQITTNNATVVNQKISEATTSINSTTDGKISNALVPVNDNINTMNATINNLSSIVMTPTQISAEVSSQITTYDTTVDNKIDNVQIGGRNYVINSINPVVHARVKPSPTDNEFSEFAAFKIGTAVNEISSGSAITISFDIEMIANATPYTLQVYNSNYQGVMTFATNIFTLSASDIVDGVIKNRYYFTTTIQKRESPTITTDSFIEFYSIYDRGNYFKITNLKIEKGNKATDWSPAPEDTASSSDVNNINNNINDIYGTTDQLGRDIENNKKDTDDVLNNMQDDIVSITNTLSTTMTSEEIEIAISTAVETNSATSVQTTTTTVNNDGLTIEKTGNDLSVKAGYDGEDAGFYVKRNNENMLAATNQGVDALNLRAQKYLIIDDKARFEFNDSNGRMCCYWLGA